MKDLKEIYEIPIHQVALKLGLVIKGNAARCFNKQNHKNNDVHPSLSFKNNYFKCFVCGVKGNVPELVKQYFQIDFKDAAKWLEENFGNNDDFSRYSPKFKPQKFEPSLKNIILTEFIELCGKVSSRARQYTQSRGLSDDIVDWFRFTDIKRDTLSIIGEKWTKEELEFAGLLKKRRFVFENHPLLIPYYYKDEVAYIKGRSLKAGVKQKYRGLNGEILIPYNVNILLDPDIKWDHVFITEGEIDCLTLLDHKINAIGVPGTNGFKLKWIEYFKKYEVIPVIAFDNDDSGGEGAKKLQLLFSHHGIGSKIIHPDKKDWNSEKWTD